MRRCRSATATRRPLRRADRRRRGDARLHRRRGDLRLDRLLAGDHRGQGLPGRPERVLPGRRRGHPGQARQGREVGRVQAEVGRAAHHPGGATSRLAAAYTAAAGRSASSTSARPTRRSTPTWPSRCSDVGTAYKNAAAEARGKDRAGYKRQGGRAVAAGKDVDTAIDGFAAAGYELDAANAAAVTKLPTLRTTPSPRRRSPPPSSQGSQPQQQQQSQPQQQQQSPAAAAAERSRSRRRSSRSRSRSRPAATTASPAAARASKTRTGGAQAPPVSLMRSAACAPRRGAAGSGSGTARRAARCRRSTRPTSPGPCRSRRRPWRSRCA